MQTALCSHAAGLVLPQTQRQTANSDYTSPFLIAPSILSVILKPFKMRSEETAAESGAPG